MFVACKKSLFAPLILLLAGCAAQPVQTPEVAAPAEPPVAELSQPIPEPPPQNPTPASGDGEDALLYNLMLGEIAAQRGQFTVATEHYIVAARQSSDARLAKRATQFALYSRNLDLAIASAKVWGELEPDSQDALQVLAAFQMQKGDRAGARESLVALLKNSNFATSNDYLRLARFFLRKDDQKPMLDVLEEIVAERPNDAEALRAYVLMAIRLGQPELALDKSSRLAASKPDALENALLHAEVLELSKKDRESADFLAEYLQRNPQQNSARLQLARQYINLKEYQLAREHFLQLYKDVPEEEGVLLALALVSLQVGNLDEARKYLLVLAKDNLQKDRAFYYLGQVSLQEKKPQEALDWFAKVTDHDYRIDATIESAEVLTKQGNLEGALKKLHEVGVSGRENQVRLYLAEVQLLIDAERYPQAEEAANRGLALYVDDVGLLLARSTAREKLNRLDEMEQDLRRVLELDDKNAHALNALGYVLADRGLRLQEARELLTKALELAPDNPFIIDSMGWLEYRLGNHEEAVRHLTRALEIMPDPEVFSHLGEVLWVMGKEQEARDVIQQGLKDTPDDRRLLGVLKKFAQ